MKKTIMFLVFVVFMSSNAYGENSLTSMAKNAGVKKCLPAIKTLDDYFTEDGDAGSHSVWNTSAPNNQFFTTVIERNFGEQSLVTSMTVTPVPDGDCSAVYDQIAYHQKSCVAVAKETFGQYEYKGTINKSVVGLESSSGTNVYLMPVASNGCVSLKKEVLFNFNSSK